MDRIEQKLTKIKTYLSTKIKLELIWPDLTKIRTKNTFKKKNM